VSVRYLTAEEVVEIGRIAVGDQLIVRDHGLVAAAAARPAMTPFGVDPYPTLVGKAVALLHSLTTSRPFVDGNKRVAFAAVDVFLKLNGMRFDPAAEDELFAAMIDIATHALDDVESIVKRISPLLVGVG
jgi:death-on-curing protein